MRAFGWLINTDRRGGASPVQFGVLLGLMCMWMFALAAMEIIGGSGRILNVAFAVIAIQALLITARSQRERVVFVVLGIALFVGPMFLLSGSGEVVGAILLGAFLVFIPLRLSLYVLEQDEVDANTVFGALCAYLFLGLSWAVLYDVLVQIRPGSVHAPDEGEPNFVTWVYFSFTTLTTLGYGDIAPRSYPARMLAILEALIGQIYLVVVVARLVGSYMGGNREEE